MLAAIILSLGITICGLALTWIGVELTIRVPENDTSRRRARWLIGIASSSLIVLTVLATLRAETSARKSEADIDDLPRRVAIYIRNTSPPPEWAMSSGVARPGAPTGLIGSVDGDWGMTAIQMGNQISNFLDSEGQPPVQKKGQSQIDFIVQSNNWYSTVMQGYGKEYQDKVISMVNVLVSAGALDKAVQPLSANPVNPTGLRMLVGQLQAGGYKYRREHSSKKRM